MRCDNILVERAEIALKRIPVRGDLLDGGRGITPQGFHGPENCRMRGAVCGRRDVAASNDKGRQIVLAQQETVVYLIGPTPLAFWCPASKNKKICRNADRVSGDWGWRGSRGQKMLGGLEHGEPAARSEVEFVGTERNQ